MALNIYDPIDSVDTSTYDWNCRVRIQSFWKGINRETKEFWGINMLLIDDSDSRIHAFANANYCDDRFKDLKEGEIYILKNFKVKDYLGDETYRPVRNKKHIFFTAHTEFFKDLKPGMPIEKYAFDLLHMSEMEKQADDNRFLIDMVGKVENVLELIKSNKDNEEKTRFKFEISNGRSNTKITLFDLFGQEFEKELSKYDSKNTFIIISCARVGRYEGIPTLSNYPATRIFINPDHYSIAELKKSWKEKQVIKTPTIIPTVVPIKTLSVKQVTTLPADYEENFVFCELVVKRINDKKNWYFRKCSGCNLELEVVDGKFKCTHPKGCGRIIPYPDKRFRLCTLCSDDTGSIVVIFPDEEITRLINKTVIDIQGDVVDEKDEDVFPQVLDCFVKHKYTIKLQIKEDNIKANSTVYEAVQIVRVFEAGDSCEPNKVGSVDMQPISIVHESPQSDPSTQTPDTGNSTNMKVRSREIVDPVDYVQDETTPAKPSKSIKVEKA